MSFERASNTRRFAWVVAAIVGLWAIRRGMARELPPETTPSGERASPAPPPVAAHEQTTVSADAARRADERSSEGVTNDGEHERVVEASLIERVEIDPPSPCRDEPVVVRVVAIASAQPLKFFVNGRAGNPVALRFSRVGGASLRVVARDWGARIDRRAETIVVRDCGERASVRLAIEQLRDERVVVRAAAAGLDPRSTRWTWSWGDESRDEGRDAREHDYGTRAQDAPSSTFVLRVEASDRHGSRAEAIETITFENDSFVTRTPNARQIPLRAPPTAEVLGSSVEFTARVDNVLHEDLRFDRVEIQRFRCDGSTLPTLAPQFAHVVMDRVDVERSSHRTVRLRFERSLLGPDACRLRVVLSARLSAGIDVTAQCSTDIAPLDGRVAVRDRALLEQLARAYARGHPTTITADDLTRARVLDGDRARIRD